MARSQTPADAGQTVYSPAVLAVYDAWVLGVSNHLLWRCPTRELRALYQRNVSAHHLDIGVGTGYYLDHVIWPIPRPRIALLDLNPNSLKAAAERIARYAPECICADASKPWPLEGQFGSAGLCYLLHCLPGAMAEKAIVFDHVARVLAPGGTIFGATIVQGDAPRSWLAQTLMDAYNRRGIFSNASDETGGLTRALEARFEDVRVRRVGCVTLFEARHPGVSRASVNSTIARPPG